MNDNAIPKLYFHIHEGHYNVLVVLSSLDNAPSTFKSLMNSIFQPFQHNLMLVFFDYILICKKTWEAQEAYVNKVLQLLWGNKLFLKCSKCSFGTLMVEYWGHLIYQDGIQVDRNKIEAI